MKTCVHTVVRQVSVSQIVHLRQRVLRPDELVTNALFCGDHLPTTKHFGLFLDDSSEVVSCASFHLNSHHGIPARQLRGMATSEEYQSQGFGQILLEEAEKILLPPNGWLYPFWCNARLRAIPFYEKLGWRCESAVFEMHGVGPHRIMTKGF